MQKLQNYRTCQLNFPPSLEKKVDLPVRKKNFLTPLSKYALRIIFLCHFHQQNVYQGKIKRVHIQAKTKCAYQGKYIQLKITFAFYEFVVII